MSKLRRDAHLPAEQVCLACRHSERVAHALLAKAARKLDLVVPAGLRCHHLLKASAVLASC